MAQRQHRDVKFIYLKDESLPFEDGFFDTVCMLAVLEHVPDERRTLQEIARVLRYEGTLILMVPHKGAFTWLDPGNIKFCFPRLHRAFHRFVARDMDTYQRRFEDLSNGLCGDISVSTMWHRHYSVAKLCALLEPYFHNV